MLQQDDRPGKQGGVKAGNQPLVSRQLQALDGEPQPAPGHHCLSVENNLPISLSNKLTAAYKSQVVLFKDIARTMHF